MKPLIGITTAYDEKDGYYFLHRAHADAIIKAGGLPVLLPYSEARDRERLVEQLDGLYLTGGNDIDPHRFKEEPHPRLGKVEVLRDRFEFALVETFIAKKKPILGVCRGSQVINVALGGTMYQDLPSQKETALLQHRQTRPLQFPSHYVYIKEDSLLFNIVKERSLLVNSNHHQANWQVGEGLLASAKSEDGVIEAVEKEAEPFILGVQWHPEQLLREKDGASLRIYRYFVKQAIKGMT